MHGSGQLPGIAVHPIGNQRPHVVGQGDLQATATDVRRMLQSRRAVGGFDTTHQPARKTRRQHRAELRQFRPANDRRPTPADDVRATTHRPCSAVRPTWPACPGRTARRRSAADRRADTCGESWGVRCHASASRNIDVNCSAVRYSTLPRLRAAAHRGPDTFEQMRLAAAGRSEQKQGRDRPRTLGDHLSRRERDTIAAAHHEIVQSGETPRGALRAPARLRPPRPARAGDTVPAPLRLTPANDPPQTTR